MTEETSEGLPIKPIFALSSATLLRGLAVVVLVGAFVCSLLGSDAPTGESLGGASAPLILGLLLAAGSLLAPGARRGARCLNVFLGVATLFSLTGLARTLQGASERSRYNSPELQAELDAHLKAIFTGPAGSGGPHMMQQADLDGLRWAEQKSVGSSARFYRIVADAEARSLGRDTLAKGYALKARLAPLDLGSFPLNAARLSDRAQLDESISVLHALHDAMSEDLAWNEKDLRETEQRLLDESAVPGPSRGYIKSRVESNDYARRLLNAVDAHLEALTTLQNARGKWSYNAKDGSFSFSVSADQASFEAALGKFRHVLSVGSIKAEGE